MNWLAQQSQSILVKDVGDAAAKMNQIFSLLSRRAARRHRWSETVWSPQTSKSPMLASKRPIVAVVKDGIFLREKHRVALPVGLSEYPRVVPGQGRFLPIHLG